MQEERPQTSESMHRDGKESLVSTTVAELKGIPTKEELKRLLEQNLVEVDFTKLNGDKRVMTCTLKDDIKPVAEKSSAKSHTRSDAAISVWDVNAKGWRSFRYERVNSVRTVDTCEKDYIVANRDK